jgi:NAD(P)-dependent dehydrogenase (short-subunit alcohol dehydrogenase family)
MARELGPEGIRVNAVAPGTIDTPLLDGKITDETKLAIAEGTPLRRLGTPEDIANAFLFLASDMSSFVTGVVLDVNGGNHIH